MSCDKDKDNLDYGPFKAGAFNSLLVNGCHVKLVQGNSNKIFSKSKTVPQIVNSGGILTINGGGEVTLEVKELSAVQLNNSDLTSDGPLHMNDLVIIAQAGEINLKGLTIDSTIYIQQNNSGKCFLYGSASYLSLSANNHARFFGYEFIADSCFVNSYAVSDLEVYAKESFKANIYGMGDVFYKGNPPVALYYGAGTGKAIPK